MKKIISILIIGVFLYGCKKSDLDLVNPNSPTPTASLALEDGILAFSKGLYKKGFSENFVYAWEMHSFMGDELYSPYGNWGWRWAEQVTGITLPNGTVLRNPIGPDQKTQLQSTNSRTAADLNVFQYEWQMMNLLNVSTNLLLKSIDDPMAVFKDDAETKKTTLRAWAYWWKGYAYSRIGSIYISGIITDASDGTTNSDYKASAEILAEADASFDKCLAELAKISPAAITTYNSTIDKVVPSFASRDLRVTPEMWVRQIYSYKARNLMANKKVADMTAGDWTTIVTLAQQGVRQGDYNFRIGMDADATNDLAEGFAHPYILLGSGQQFTFVSERLVQDYAVNDQRFVKNFALLASPNLRSDRGFNFGTRYGATAIEDGGSFSTSDNLGFMELGCTYEETQLDIAEANIRNGAIDAGLLIVDAIRTFQGAGVPATSATGKTLTAALEILKAERRVALFQRGTAFYDARRWGITAPASAGGGRANAVVLIPATVLGTTNAQIRSCFIEYNFMDYFDVPLNEIDFNDPSPGSGPVKTQ